MTQLVAVAVAGEYSLKQSDSIRFYSAQFSPADCRADLCTLYAFDMEIRKVSQSVREPMAGEIRLQWWRDVFLGERDGEAAASPIALAILELMRRRALPSDVFETYLDGRIFDLYQDKMQDQQAFEAYAGQTDGTIFQLASIISDPANARSAAVMNGYLACVSALWTRCIVPLAAGSDAGMHYLPAKNGANPYLMDAKDLDIASSLAQAIDMADLYLTEARKIAEQQKFEKLHHIYLPMALISKQLSALKAGRPTIKEPQRFSQIWQIWRASKRWPCF
ncbi:MAG: squalene/phytoene synthase family protein [Rhizobiales bacterium]|nr:squalene/phytoene synthase family protein [Hyphomicrobiales bacterium]